MPLPGDGSDLVVSCLILPRSAQPRPSLNPHLLDFLVAVELEALLGKPQVQILVVFLAHGSLVSRNLLGKSQQHTCDRRR